MPSDLEILVGSRTKEKTRFEVELQQALADGDYQSADIMAQHLAKINHELKVLQSLQFKNAASNHLYQSLLDTVSTRLFYKEIDEESASSLKQYYKEQLETKPLIKKETAEDGSLIIEALYDIFEQRATGITIYFKAEVLKVDLKSNDEQIKIEIKHSLTDFDESFFKEKLIIGGYSLELGLAHKLMSCSSEKELQLVHQELSFLALNVFDGLYQKNEVQLKINTK
jgi:predicted chitinase